jgi:NTP pyrophosphatase (non-canonical NTP hydrolase)
MYKKCMVDQQLRLDDLYKLIAHIYSEQNAHRPASATFSHFVEVCGMLSVHDRQKKREDVTVEDALCKAFGWYFPLLAKFKVSSVEELVYRKYPNVCPYCRLKPHNDIKCKNVRGVQKTLDHDALRKLGVQNQSYRPKGIDQWQEMFQEIYPRSIDDRSARSTLGLFEELGELAEAVRVFERYPKYFAGEAADVFSYLMGIANEHALRLQRDFDKDFSLEAELIKRYPGLCTQCGYSICVCPLVPESTVGRMAKELEIGSAEDLFALKPDVFRAESNEVAGKVVEKLGGYSEIAHKFPYDRGDANRALVLLCLKLAEAVQEKDATVADGLRSAAIKVGNAATFAGSRSDPQQLQGIIDSIKGMLSQTPEDVRSAIIGTTKTLEGKVGELIGQHKHVLVIFANPQGTDVLKLAEEERAIKEAIKKSKGRDFIHVHTLQAATVDDLSQALLEQECEIVHFSGHGNGDEILFQDALAGEQSSPLEALRDLLTKYPVKCLILNSCNSASKLKTAIAPVTVGMTADADDDAAIEFTRGFYDAVGAGKDYEFSIGEGIDRVRMKGMQLDVKVLKK